MAKLKPKPIYELLFMLINKYFLEDFRTFKLCSEDDKILYDLNEDMLKELYDKWLVDNGYMEYDYSEE